ncbi:O-antigen ligase family protein [Lactiplantibacillus plajomi]|uniref:O-antigen ligase family protein n=1 Tax=Lactiplantibacillus plajomi TaxID=1457217 RepID=A0ABV6K456_9LACO|nr:O-antigen ligase family protein [Lactiplantibacillus plajomi]
MKANRQPKPILLGLNLLAVLPPVGIALLIYLSRWQWLELLRHPQRLRHDPVLWFFGGLMVVTGLNLTRHSPQTVLLSLIMLVVVLNLWLLCRFASDSISLNTCRDLIIRFGLYITISGNLFHWISMPAWLKFLSGNLLWGYAANQNRLFGSAYNPNDACCLMLIALGLALVRRTITAHAKPTIHELVTLTILGIGILQTQSRTGIGLMAILFVTVLFIRYRRHRVLIILIAGACLALTLTLLPRHGTLLATLATRLSIWHNSFAVFTQSPILGVTYYGFSHQYQLLTGTSVPHAHDIFLMLLASFGLVGGGGFTILAIRGGWQLRQIWQRYRPDNVQYLVVTLPLIFAYGITDFVLSSFQVLVIVLLLFAYWQRETVQQKIRRSIKKNSSEKKVTS